MNNGNEIKTFKDEVLFVDKNPAGAWRVSSIVGEGSKQYLLERVYYFTSKQEAIKLFKQEVKELI